MGSFKDMKIRQTQLTENSGGSAAGLSFRTVRAQPKFAVPDPTMAAANDFTATSAAIGTARRGSAMADSGSIRLGVLEVHPRARAIVVDGCRADLGGRAFDLLMALIEAGGQIVSKEDLLRRVWPTVTIIESNLKVQLSLLRRALGPERWRIKTISGRGYLLITDDAEIAGSAPIRAPATSHPFVIVVDVDPNTQDVLVNAISEVARQFDALLSSPDLSGLHLASLA